MKLPKAARLRRRREFLAAKQRGARLHAGAVLVLVVEGASAGRARIGITVSSKVANAVERNRVKRWVREAFREIQAGLPPVDLVVIARQGAVAMGIDGARRALADAALKLKERAP